jgi:hypothetical protein
MRRPEGSKVQALRFTREHSEQAREPRNENATACRGVFSFNTFNAFNAFNALNAFQRGMTLNSRRLP